MKVFKKAVAILVLVLFSSILSGCIARLPVPEIKEGRFNFSFTYEMNGEEITYNGVYICEFDGIYTSCNGAGRDWTGHIEGLGRADDVLIQTNNDGNIYIGFAFCPDYLMGDPYYADYEPYTEPTLYIAYHSDDPNSMMYDSELDFMAEYGIRIISYDYPEPIENKYENKLRFGRFHFSIN